MTRTFFFIVIVTLVFLPDSKVAASGMLGSWTPIAAKGAPAGRYFHESVWTGREVLIWGGRNCADKPMSTGGRFNPGTETWKPMASKGAPKWRLNSSHVWTGREWIVWGGEDLSTRQTSNAGFAYDPQKDAWRKLSLKNAPSPRADHAAIWDGSRMLVWGGGDGNKVYADGGLYDPSTDAWTSAPFKNAPSGRFDHRLVRHGDAAYLVGGLSLSGARLRPAMFRGGAWHPAPESSLAIWASTDNRTAIGDFLLDLTPPKILKGEPPEVIAVDLRAQKAVRLSIDLKSRDRVSSLPTGSAIASTHGGAVLWGGLDLQGPRASASGVFVSISKQQITWSKIQTTGSPSPRFGTSIVAIDDRKILIWGGRERDDDGPCSATGAILSLPKN